MPESKPVAIITGGSSGIGNACATALCEKYHIVIADINNAEEAARQLPAPGTGIALDISSFEDCLAMAQKAASIGPVTALIHCAGICSKTAYIDAMDIRTWIKTMNVNINGTFFVTKAVAPVLEKNASVILFGSRTGRTGNAARELGQPTHADYGTSKAAIISYVRSLAFELAPRGIRVNGIAPGPVITPLIGAGRPQEEVLRTIPLGRQATPRDITPAVEFLCSDGASWITGHTLDINGGMYM